MMDYRKRVKLFRKIGTVIKKRKFELSAWLTFENGKNRYEAIADIDEAIDFIMFYSHEMQKNKGFVTRKLRSSKRAEYKYNEAIWSLGCYCAL